MTFTDAAMRTLEATMGEMATIGYRGELRGDALVLTRPDGTVWMIFDREHNPGDKFDQLVALVRRASLLTIAH